MKSRNTILRRLYKGALLWSLLAMLTSACTVSDSGGGAADTGGADTIDAGSATSDRSSDVVGDSSDDYLTCERSTHVGSFTLALKDTYTTIQGQISDGVDPITVSDVTMTAEGCEFLTPPQLFCDPGCTGGETCSADGTCVALPANRDVGEVTIHGLGVDVTMTARAPVYYYTFVGDLPHPAFTSSSVVTLSASGGDFSPFELTAPGVDPLHTEMTSVAIESGLGVELTWVAGQEQPGVRIEVELNIANHGGTPARVECVVEDDGAFTIPAELVTALLENGYSGFPSLRMIRQGADAKTTDPGCVELRLQSEIVLPVDIPGLISCSNNEDCPENQTCLGDLTCG